MCSCWVLVSKQGLLLVSCRKSSVLTGFWWVGKGCCLFSPRGVGVQGEKFFPRGLGAQERKLVGYKRIVFYVVLFDRWIRYYVAIMRHDIHVCTYVMGQYEFFDNYKAMMVLLSIGLWWVRVKGFLLAISLWHELSKSALTEFWWASKSCCL